MKDRPSFGKIGGTLLAAGALIVFWLMLPVASSAQRPSKGTSPKKDPAGEASDPEPKKGGAAKKDTKPAKKDAPRVDPDKKDEFQIVDLETDDGVLIAATYFPSNLGKNAPAVILLHGYGDKQRVFDDLAFALQRRGYAVLTFDFRGHGKSTSLVRNPTRAEPKAGPMRDKLDFHDLGKKADMPYAALLMDIEAAKRFLVRRNNAGELNVSKLGVVGCEMGASLALMWSHRDWQYPTQVGFGGKQGQDVQTVSLISPSYNLKGLAVTKELADLQRVIPIQVLVGKKKKKAFDEASKIYESAKRARPGEGDSDFKEFDTELQGKDLLNPDHGFDADKAIIKFFDGTLKNKPVGKWEMREVSNAEAGE